jgi:hypothetical protein
MSGIQIKIEAFQQLKQEIEKISVSAFGIFPNAGYRIHVKNAR